MRVKARQEEADTELPHGRSMQLDRDGAITVDRIMEYVQSPPPSSIRSTG